MHGLKLSILCAFSSLLSLAAAGTAHLPAYPLAVRSPWLSAWLKGDVSNDLPTAQATFWTDAALGWEVMVRVNDAYYTVFGYPAVVIGASPAIQNSINFTSTHTYVSLSAGAADLTLDFFSPVSPNNLLRQSLPYSYLTVTAAVPDGTTIQIFSAIDERWTGGPNNVANNLLTSGNTYAYTLNHTEASTYDVDQDMALWGSVVYATQASSGSVVSAQCGSAIDIHAAFTNGHGLNINGASTCDGGPQCIYAYLHDLGIVQDTASVTFAIGQSREDAIEFMQQPQTNYYRAMFSTIPEAVDHFFSDYPSALSESLVFDAEILTNATSVSTEYADILEASVRQTFGAMEITIPSSTLDTTNPLVFLKEISSNGDIQTVDVIYPTFPIFYLICPEWIKYLLAPIFIYLESPGAWSNPYMIHDLGEYPIANGHDDNKAEHMPLDSTAMAMVLIYAYQDVTGDKAWAQQYAPLLQTYADYLVANGAANEVQLSTVDAISAHENQTMLAVQSAIGLTAYGALSGQQKYTQAGLQLANTLYATGEALDPQGTHFTFYYGDPSFSQSWSVLFPLFADTLLSLSTFPASAYALQSTFYSTQFSPFGLQYKSDLPWGITDWNMWAGAVASPDVLSQVISTTHMFLTDPRNTKPFQTKYLVMGDDAGLAVQNIARSTVGSNFAVLALRKAKEWVGMGDKGTIPAGSVSSSSTSSTTASTASLSLASKPVHAVTTASAQTTASMTSSTTMAPASFSSTMSFATSSSATSTASSMTTAVGSSSTTLTPASSSTRAATSATATAGASSSFLEIKGVRRLGWAMVCLCFAFFM